MEGRTLVEVTIIEGDPDTVCRSVKEEAAWQACMEKRYRTIPGPGGLSLWRPSTNNRANFLPGEQTFTSCNGENPNLDVVEGNFVVKDVK